MSPTNSFVLMRQSLASPVVRRLIVLHSYPHRLQLERNIAAIPGHTNRPFGSGKHTPIQRWNCTCQALPMALDTRAAPESIVVRVSFSRHNPLTISSRYLNQSYSREQSRGADIKQILQQTIQATSNTSHLRTTLVFSGYCAS